MFRQLETTQKRKKRGIVAQAFVFFCKSYILQAKMSDVNIVTSHNVVGFFSLSVGYYFILCVKSVLGSISQNYTLKRVKCCTNRLNIIIIYL